jgi:hypothetical protein
MGADARKDYFDQWWEWAEKLVESTLTIPAVIHSAVMAFRRKTGETVRRSMMPRAGICGGN